MAGCVQFWCSIFRSLWKELTTLYFIAVMDDYINGYAWTMDMRYSPKDDLGWISCVIQLVSPFQFQPFSKNCRWLSTAKYFWMPGSIVSKPIWPQWKKWVFTPMSRCLVDPSHAFSHSSLAMPWAVADGETIKWLGCWIHQGGAESIKGMQEPLVKRKTWVI